MSTWLWISPFLSIQLDWSFDQTCFEAFCFLQFFLYTNLFLVVTTNTFIILLFTLAIIVPSVEKNHIFIFFSSVFIVSHVQAPKCLHMLLIFRFLHKHALIPLKMRYDEDTKNYTTIPLIDRYFIEVIFLINGTRRLVNN